MPPEPNFFLVGAPKAGTTSLYHYLDQHPQIFMSPIKEPNYFASEIRLENFCEELQPRARRDQNELMKYLSGPMLEKRFGGIVSEWDDYMLLFQNVRAEVAIGEASVCYLWSQTAARNIAAKIPDARILMILRDPVERAFSQYLQMSASGLARTSFGEQIEMGLRPTNPKFDVWYPFLEFGLYYEQIERYLKSFPRENIRIEFYEDIKAQPTQVIRNVFGFLQVDDRFLPDATQKHLEPKIPRFRGYRPLRRWKNLCPGFLRPIVKKMVFQPRSTILVDTRDRKRLIEYYQEDIRKLASLLDRDLCSWLR